MDAPVSADVSPKQGRALRTWSIVMAVASVLSVVWALNQSEILGPLELPRWVHDVATLVAPATVAAAFAVNVASFVRRHRTAVDIIALVVATLVFVVVALFVLGEFLFPH